MKKAIKKALIHRKDLIMMDMKMDIVKVMILVMMMVIQDIHNKEVFSWGW